MAVAVKLDIPKTWPSDLPGPDTAARGSTGGMRPGSAGEAVVIAGSQ